MIQRLFALLLLLLPCGSGSVFAEAPGSSLARTSLLENDIVYLRVGQLDADLADEISNANLSLAGTNKIIGTVLDLRSAKGDDPSILKSTADLFSAKKLPLTILVDANTEGTATALATKLRQSRLGLIFGAATLGLKPDISVNFDTNNEKIYLQNPYALLNTNSASALNATNDDLLPYVDHTSEAELVQERRKDGADDENAPVIPRPEPPRPVIHDPVLSRAVDLLKGLAVIRAARG